MWKEIEGLEIVGEVADGPTLAVALEQMQPDCLLIDVAMPDFEPVSAMREIRANYPNMKILVVSAYDDDVYVQGLFGAGCGHFLAQLALTWRSPSSQSGRNHP